MIPIQHIKIQNYNGSYLYFDNSIHINLTHYVITFKTSEYNKILYVKFDIIAFDMYLTYYHNLHYQRYINFNNYLCDSATYFNNISIRSNYQGQNRIFWGIRGG